MAALKDNDGRRGKHEEIPDQDESEILTDKLLQSLAKSFGNEWRLVAISLNFKPNEVEQLEHDCKLLADMATKMLFKWRRRLGKERGMIDMLRSALIEHDRHDMAEELERKISRHRRSDDAQEEQLTGDNESDQQTGNHTANDKNDLERQNSCEGYDAIENMNMVDEDFIETPIFEEAKRILMNEKLIWITGKNGSGKTSLAYHLFTSMIQNVDKDMFCEKVDDILNELNGCIEKDWIFFVDDVFGTLKVETDAVKQYERLIEAFPKIQEEQNETDCKTFMIFCTRKDILQEIAVPIPKKNIIDISFEQDSIPKSEKRRLFEKIWQKHNIDSDIPAYISDFDFPNNDHFGFWFCADFHARRSYADGKSFWEDPLVVLLQEMKLHIDNKSISPDICKDLAFHQSHVSMRPRDIDICKNYPEFFKLTKQECFEFQHLLLHEQIELHLTEKNVPDGILHLGVKSLHKIKVCLPKKGKSRLAKKVRENPLCLTTETDVCHLLRRLVTEVQKGNVHEVSKHDIWKEDQPAFLLDEHIFKTKEIDDVISILTTEDKSTGDNILYWSSIYNRTALFDVLVRYFDKSNDSFNAIYYLSRALIGACAVKKNVSIVKELIRKGADVSFCFSCQSNDKKRDKNVPNCEMMVTHVCPLIVAIQNANTNHVIQLLRNKAKIPHNSWPDWDLLHNCSELQPELLKDPSFLQGLTLTFNNLENKQNTSCSLEKNNFSELLSEIRDACDEINEIFLVFAKHGFLSISMLEAFIKSRANINTLDNQKQNVLHLLIGSEESDSEKKFEVIEKLLKVGCDGNQKSKQRDTPLSLAIKRKTNSKRLCEVLLAEDNVDPNTVFADGKSPLHLCIENVKDEEESISLVTLLLKKGGRPLPDKNGYTAIDLAFLETSPKINLILALSPNPIHSCIESSNLTSKNKCELINFLVNHEIDINQKDESNHTPLSKALLNHCKQELIDCLLKHQADISLRYGNDQSILQVIFSANYIMEVSILKQFMEKDSRLLNRDSIPVLCDALNCHVSQFTIFKQIIFDSHQDTLYFQNFQDSESNSLLHLCIKSSMSDDECIDCFSFLQPQSISREQKISHNFTAINLAAQNKQACRAKTIIRMLSDGYYKSKSFRLKIFLSDLLQSGQICSDIINILNVMISKNQLSQSIVGKSEILHSIAKFGEYSKWICQDAIREDKRESESNLETGSHVRRPSTQDSQNLTASETNFSCNVGIVSSGDLCQSNDIQHSIVTKESETLLLIKSLCVGGFDIDKKDSDGRTPLYLSCCRNDPNIELITAFCKSNSNVNLADNEGRTPLHACVASKMDDKACKTVCQVMVDYEAKVNKSDGNKRTPFLLACEQDLDRSLTIRFLLKDCSSDIDVRDIKGDSCLHICINKNVPDFEACELIELLLAFNPKLDIKNNFRLTSLNLAATCQTRSRILCMLYLLAKGSDVNTIDHCKRTPLYNVLRCLDGKHSATTTALERMVRLSLLFAFGSNPSIKPDFKEDKWMDSFVLEMIRDYPDIQIERLEECITEKLIVIGKNHHKSNFNDPFVFKPSNPKRKLYGKVLEASKYLKDAYFKISEELRKGDTLECSDGNKMQAQVAVLDNKLNVI